MDIYHSFKRLLAYFHRSATDETATIYPAEITWAEPQIYRGRPVLTLCETQVAWLVRLGYDNQEIARELNINLGAVKAHIHNLLVKFNLRSRWVLRDLLIELDFNPWNG